MRFNLPTIFVLILAISSFGVAQSPDVLAASSGPWIPLVVIALLRTALCLGNEGSLHD